MDRASVAALLFLHILLSPFTGETTAAAVAGTPKPLLAPLSLFLKISRPSSTTCLERNCVTGSTVQLARF
jgi:hypothetical protein